MIYTRILTQITLIAACMRAKADSHKTTLGVTLNGLRYRLECGEPPMKDHPSKALPASSGNSETEKTTTRQALVDTPPNKPVEVGGPKGPEPTRYGDWEKAGRCTDF
jgi:hypothetical protein